MPRFVILRHEIPSGSGRGLHWDFMLEWQEALRTWALAVEPSVIGGSCYAEQLADHRAAYLDYEGEISGGRGTVSRFDAGDYRLVCDDEQIIVVNLSGGRLRGTATLTRGDSDDQRWRFSFVSEGTAASGLSRSTTGDPSGSRGTV
jgi:hypothetical protein